MLEEPNEDRVIPLESIGEEEPKTEEDQDEPESEEEQRSSVLFTQEQLEILLKMNRPDFSELVVALKGGASKDVMFQPAKLGNSMMFVTERLWALGLQRWEDYLHAAKVRRHLAVELAQSYLKGYAATWWKTVR